MDPRKDDDQTPDTNIVSVEKLGRNGDGIVYTSSHPDKPVYVPFAYPGDQVILDDIELKAGAGKAATARVQHWISRSKNRVSPLCEVYESCGGCRHQHIPHDERLELLTAEVHAAWKAHGLTAPDIQVVSGSTHVRRRRARFVWKRQKGRVKIGFRALGSHDIVDVDTCATVDPYLLSRLPELGKAFLACPGLTHGEFTLARFDQGLDLTLHCDLADSAESAIFMADLLALGGIIRVVVDTINTMAPPPLVELVPTISIDKINIQPPSGAFRQAADSVERYLQDRVFQWMKPHRRIIDLYAGWGSLSDRLARGRVLCLADSEADVVGAGVSAIRAAGCRVSGEVRNLMRRPISADALSKYDAAILDPPRAGAKAQTVELAASSLKHIVYVSCNAQTLARDAETLQRSGFQPGRIYVIDAFPFTGHIEMITQFRR